MAEEHEGGVVLRGDDGSLYFIRESTLAACKAEGEFVDRVNEMVEGSEVEGYALTTTSLSTVTTVSSTSTSTPTVKPAGTTMMCPW